MALYKKFIQFTYLPVFAALSVASFHVAAGPKNEVPLKASFTTTEKLIPPDGSSTKCDAQHPFQGMLQGRGTASHLGHITLDGQDCVKMTPVPTAPTVLPVELNFVNGALTMTAANGDKLYATYEGTFMLDNTDPTTGLLPKYKISTGGFKILGGTGRFINATGSGLLNGTEIIAPDGATGTLDLSGTIAYPN